MSRQEPHLCVSKQTTFDEIRADLEAQGEVARIVYSSRTCWWASNPNQLYGGKSGDVPRDPTGAPLFEEHDWHDWLKGCEDNPGHYGKHGVDALLAAHALNTSGTPVAGVYQRFAYAALNWDVYNVAIDEAIKAGLW